MAHQVFACVYLSLASFFFIFSSLRLLIRVFSRLANIFVLLAQGLERGSYEPDVTGSIPVWDMSFFGAELRPNHTPVQKRTRACLPPLHPLQTEGPPRITASATFAESNLLGRSDVQIAFLSLPSTFYQG